MNITFFIGNGFDINLGLKTSYSDFYPYFIENAKSDNVIKEWLIQNGLWSDLEEQLGKSLSKLDEGKLNKFYDDKDEMDLLLLEYLEREQNQFDLSDEEHIKKELIRSLTKFDVGLSKVEKDSIQDTKKAYRNENFVYQFVSFNYTYTLDKVVEIVCNEYTRIGKHESDSCNRSESIGEVIHIHGTIDEEMILGVNDESQVNNEFLKANSEFLDTFVKQRTNNAIGQLKVQSVKEVIEKSHIICVFGMSLGNTDKIWWEEIVKWLTKNGYNKVVIFMKGYEDVFTKKMPSKTIRLKNSIKRRFFEQGRGNFNEEMYEEVKDRIMISYNSDIFNFNKK